MIVVIRNKFPWQHVWAERTIITSHAFPLVQRLRDKKSYKLICKTVCDKKQLCSTVLCYRVIRRSCKSVYRMSSSDTTAVTRPLHQVNRLRKSTRSNPERRYSRRSPRLQYASHSGFATHKPVVLKEGYLNKPSFFRFVSTS